jgi:hypothetical protein
MPWDGKKLPDAMASGATAAANAAANGAKNTAFLTYIQTEIGANYLRQLYREDTKVWEATASGTLPIVGSQIVLPTTATQDSISAADIDTGAWQHYVRSASDTNKYIATAVTTSGGAGPARLSADLANAGSVTLGSFVFNSPSFDPAVGEGPFTLADAYSTAMTSLNDFPPGNSAGNPDWVNSIWPFSSNFGTSPYGANIDPIKFGQNEPGVGVTDANYIVTRRAAANRYATAFTLWPWFMPPKGAVQPVGNWRIQIRDIQAAVKVDALTNPWTMAYGPGQVPTYGNNNLGGLRVSGQYMDYTDSNRVPAFDVNNNFLEARFETGGGISFKNVGTSTSAAMFEPNIPDPAAQLPASATSNRTVAFAAVYWARLTTDVSTSALTPGIRMGGIMGVDFYDGSGRVGTPGQSRLVELSDAWKPVVVAFVLTGAPPSAPMTPAQTATWLSANPPPFT